MADCLGEKDTERRTDFGSLVNGSLENSSSSFLTKCLIRFIACSNTLLTTITPYKSILIQASILSTSTTSSSSDVWSVWLFSTGVSWMPFSLELFTR